MHGDAQPAGFCALEQRNEGLGIEVHFVVRQVQCQEPVFVVEGKIHPVRIVLNRFGALQDADEAHGHRVLGFSPSYATLDRLLQRIGGDVGVLVQQETRGVTQFQYAYVGVEVHVLAYLKRHLFNAVGRIEYVPGIEELVQDGWQFPHGGLNEKRLGKLLIVRHVVSALQGEGFERFLSNGQLQMAVEFHLGHRLDGRIDRLCFHGSKVGRQWPTWCTFVPWRLR